MRGRNAKNAGVAPKGEKERRRRNRGGAMRDVSGKAPTRRSAAAEGVVERGIGEAVQDGTVELTAEQLKRRKARSVAIATVLGALAVLFYVVTVVKLGPAVLIRPL